MARPTITLDFLSSDTLYEREVLKLFDGETEDDLNERVIRSAQGPCNRRIRHPNRTLEHHHERNTQSEFERKRPYHLDRADIELFPDFWGT